MSQLVSHWMRLAPRLSLYRHVQRASMAYDSSDKIHQSIHKMINESPKRVFVFMKGEPSQPQCRYSGVVAQIMDAYGIDYDSCDVLSNESLRHGIKSYSDWPTIPQVFLDRAFVGGCDIMLQMHQSGELKDLFGGQKSSPSDARDQ